MFKLVAQDGTQYPITGPALTIGREGCDVLLAHDEGVSRQHAKVEQRGDALVLLDLDSTNHTFVNGVRLQAHEPYTLRPGDVIRVGNTHFTFHAEGQAPATRLISETPQGQAFPAPGPGFPAQPASAPPYQAPPAPGPGFSAQPAPVPPYQVPPAPGPGFPAQSVPVPPYQAPPVLGPMPPPYAAPAPYRPPMPYSQPTKDKAIAYILEIVLLGLGWIYAGETGTGIAILASWIIVGLVIGIGVDVATGGLGCLCTGPLAIAAYVLSLTQLSKYMNSRPDKFR